MAKLYPEAAQPTVLPGVGPGGTIHTPPAQDFDTPAMEGSLQQFLADNLGQYVVVEFLVGTGELVTKAGVLYAVGTSVMTLYQELTQTFVTCDLFSIKFVTFYLPGRRPWQMAAPGQWGTAMPGQGGMPAPGFAPPMDTAVPGQGGCVTGSCGGGAPWG